VLDAAFALLGRESGPVLEDYPETVEDLTDSPLECPLPPRSNEGLPRAVDEAMALRPAYNRQLAKTGRSVVGKVVGPDRVPDVVAIFDRIAAGESWDQLSAVGVPRLVAQDVRGYYEEAAMALADHVPGAHAAEAWFFTRTAAGDAIRNAQKRMKEGGAPQPDWFFLVPRSFQLP
jgi:hypothetical protein